MSKVLITDYEKCTGCRACELACSVMHEGVSNPERSRIKVVKWEWEGRYVPMSCQQCESAPCMAICPVRAIYRDEELDRVMIDYEVCITCRMCVAACPFGAMGYDTNGRKVIKCDLCEGDPQCVRFCETKAVRYEEAAEQSAEKRIEAAERLTGAIQKARALAAEQV